MIIYFLLFNIALVTGLFLRGHADEGESEIETAKRELEEETGISEIEIKQNIFFLEKYEFEKGDVKIKKTAKFFLGFVKNKDIVIQEEELKDYKWLPEKEAMDLLTYKETKGLFQEVLDFLKVSK